MTRDCGAVLRGKIHEDFSFATFLTPELKGKTLGVVGAGKIGSRIAEMALGLGMKVLYYSRRSKLDIEKLGAKKAEFEDVLTQSDFVGCALLLSKETEGIINAALLSECNLPFL